MKEEIHIPDYLMLPDKVWDPRHQQEPMVSKPLYTRFCCCEKFGLMERMWYGPACKKCLEEEL